MGVEGLRLGVRGLEGWGLEGLGLELSGWGVGGWGVGGPGQKCGGWIVRTDKK